MSEAFSPLMSIRYYCVICNVHHKLKADPAIEVVGEAINGEDAIARAFSQHPDVILMDLNMPGMNGLEAILRAKDAGMS
jgi:YesN/AraC family two-component response regulator